MGHEKNIHEQYCQLTVPERELIDIGKILTQLQEGGLGTLTKINKEHNGDFLAPIDETSQMKKKTANVSNIATRSGNQKLPEITIICMHLRKKTTCNCERKHINIKA